MCPWVWKAFAMLVFMTAVHGDLSNTVYDYINTMPCKNTSSTCEYWLILENKLTMLWEGKLLVPFEGKLYDSVDVGHSSPIDVGNNSFIQGDGHFEKVRAVTVINNTFPGPTIELWEGQEVTIHVSNRLTQEGATLHWHGLWQVGTPYMDGVAFLSQCPILPGQDFEYRYNATPRGTFWYHSHMGDQRTDGLFGALIIHPRPEPNPADGEFITMLNDWNHDWNAAESFLRSSYGAYTGTEKYNKTHSLDGGGFGPYPFQAGLINGKGRYYTDQTNHNNPPLTQYNVTQGKTYRFRVIGSGNLYPFRAWVESHRMLMVATDGFDIVPIPVDEFIINPGERYDFIIVANQTESNYWILAETLEVDPPTRHVAEAVLHYTGSVDPANIKYAITDRPTVCNAGRICFVMNCPYLYYPANDFRVCLTFRDMQNSDSHARTPTSETGYFEEIFLNFGFPKDPVTGITPASVNGRQMQLPTVGYYAQRQLATSCDTERCGLDKVCKCTNRLTLTGNRTYQFVFTNIGSGHGDSHPIHMHGHSFYVVAVGYGEYNNDTGRLINTSSSTTTNKDIQCLGSSDFCNNATWKDSTWNNGNIPHQNVINPPRKDTIIVPTEGYVVVRITTQNPGVWFMHCHIEFHNLLGMAIMLDEDPLHQPAVPNGFPTCGNFNLSGTTVGSVGESSQPVEDEVTYWKRATLGLGVTAGVASTVAIGCIVAVMLKAQAAASVAPAAVI